MSLTVPRAGLQAGRSASIRINEPQIGNAVAQFGDVMREVGGALEAERLDRTRARDRLALTQAMEDLSLQADQVGDPDELDALWKQGVAERRKAYLETVDPQLRPQAELEFDARVQPYGIQIGRRQLGLMNDQRMATYTQAREAVVRQAATMEPDAAAQLLATHDAEIDGLVQRNLMPADRAMAERMAVRAEAETVRATRLLDTDPAALVTGLDAGAFPNMDPRQAETFRSRGTSAIAAEQARQATAAKAENGARISAARDVLKDGSEVFRKGRAFSRQSEADALLADPEIAALPEAQAYARSAMLFEQMPGFAPLSLAEKDRLISEVEAQPIDTPDAARVVEAMRENRTAHREAVRKDPWAYGASVGVVAPQPLPDPSDAGFAPALQRRRADMARLEASGIIDGPAPLFTPAEAEALAPLAAPTASPAERAGFAAGLAQLLKPEDMDRAASLLKADPVFGYVGTGLAAGELPPVTARQIFEGQRAIDSKDVSLPAIQDRREPWFESFADLFEDGTRIIGYRPNGEPIVADDETGPRDRILAAADALYAFKVRGDLANTKDGKLSATHWQQALHEALGGIGTVGGSDARGGIGEVRGAKVLLPPGVSAVEVQGGLIRIETALGSAPYAANDPGRAGRILADLSPGGQPPQIGGQDMDAATWRRLRVKSTGDGFALIWTNTETGRENIVTDAAGDPWIIDPARLIRGAGR